MDVAKKNPNAKAILVCKKVSDYKRYGVPTVEVISNNLFSVNEVIEKPNKPKSNLGILPLYYFFTKYFFCVIYCSWVKNCYLCVHL